MAKSTRSAQNFIDWSKVGDKVCEVLTVANDNRTGIVAFAKEQKVPYESIVAAAVTGMISEHVEEELAKQLRRKAPSKKTKPTR